MSILAQQRGTEARPCTGGGAARALLEYAVGQAPSHLPPPRGLRRLFARDRSARALVERYRLWPEIEYAYARIVREFGSARIEVTAENDYGEPYVVMDCYVSPPRDTDTRLDFEEVLTSELIQRLGTGFLRLTVLVHGDYPRKEADE
jgi:hypothetical protein